MQKTSGWIKKILIFLIVFQLAGCSSEGTAGQPQTSAAPEAEVPVIGISFPTTELAYRERMKEIVEAAFPEGNSEAELIIRDAEGSQKTQNQDILDLVEAGVDGIVLIPYTMEGPISAVQYANDRGIPVITVDNTLEDDGGANVISYVGADHTKMGKQAANLLLQVLEEKLPEKDTWNIIELAGSPDASGTVDRESGIDEVLSAESRIHMLGTFNAEFTIEDGKSVMDDCLQVYDDINGIICQNDLMALGCYESLEEAGKLGDIILIGIDGQRDVVEKMLEGGLDGTVFQDPEMILVGVQKLLDYLNGEEIDSVYYQETYVITRDNAKIYLEETRAW